MMNALPLVLPLAPSPARRIGMDDDENTFDVVVRPNDYEDDNENDDVLAYGDRNE